MYAQVRIDLTTYYKLWRLVCGVLHYDELKSVKIINDEKIKQEVIQEN